MSDIKNEVMRNKIIVAVMLSFLFTVADVITHPPDVGMPLMYMLGMITGFPLIAAILVTPLWAVMHGLRIILGGSYFSWWNYRLIWKIAFVDVWFYMAILFTGFKIWTLF